MRIWKSDSVLEFGAKDFFDLTQTLTEFDADWEGDSLLSSIDLSVVPCAEEETLADDEEGVPPTPRAFPDFPYPTVYPQQLSMMTALYKTLEEKRCGLFESPTGTGKSLSLLNASLRWLLDHNERLEKRFQELSRQLPKFVSGSGNVTGFGKDWVSDYEKLRASRLQLKPEIESLSSLHTSLVKIKDIKSGATNRAKPILSQHTSKNLSSYHFQDTDSGETKSVELSNDEDSFLLDCDENNSPTECDTTAKEARLDPVGAAASEAFCQIIYCSRTHSQLGQVLDELANCPSLFRQITSLQLASRSMLCTNSNVYRLTQQQLINEACMQLNQKKTGCPVRNKTAVTRLSNQLLSGLAPTQVVSAIREGKTGSLLSTDMKNKPLEVQLGCPYYSTKQAVSLAQLLLVPYATLLQKSTREAFNLRLKNAVIIIDEAHNLLGATTDALSAHICLNDLRLSSGLLRAYQIRYRTRLSPLSSLRLRQLALYSDRLASLLTDSAEARVLSVPQTLVSAGVDHINIGDLVDFYTPTESEKTAPMTAGGGSVRRHFGAKLFGFSKWMASAAAGKPNQEHVSESMPDDRKKSSLPSGMHALLTGMKRTREGSQSIVDTDQHQTKVVRTTKDLTQTHLSPEDFEVAGASFFKLQHFLNTVASCEEDARIVIKPGGSIKAPHCSDTDVQCSNVVSLYVTVLNPGRYLASLVKESRSLILVGGTMRPFKEFIDQIFLPIGQKEADIVTFTCDHVVDAKTSLAVFPLALFLPDGQPLEFNFSKRCLPSFMDACGNAVLQICRISPAGMVLFLPSYDYQSCICTHWEATGLMQRLRREKPVFREPRNADCLVKVMQAYSQSARKDGALLICVIGGKLSEGINFSDDLARSLVIVGLPYANPHCPLLREKMSYLDRCFPTVATASRSQWAASPGRRHYEALCMRAINQTIGRAVRHAGDYAAVFLLDKRFTRTTVQTSLPGWVQKGLRGVCRPEGSAKSTSLHDAIAEARQFFKLIRQNKTE